MPKKDANQLAKFVADQATSEEEKPDLEKGKNLNYTARARAGGLKGGKARAKKLSSKQRKDIARKAAMKRWG